MGLLPVIQITKWRTTPVVGEVSAEALVTVAGDAVVDAAEAVEGAVVPGAASPRTRNGCLSRSWAVLSKT